MHSKLLGSTVSLSILLMRQGGKVALITQDQEIFETFVCDALEQGY